MLSVIWWINNKSYSLSWPIFLLTNPTLLLVTTQLLSIVIPVYNEERYIYTVLETVAATTLGDGWQKEIIVVDDCSDDDTQTGITAFLKAYPEVNIKSLLQE